MGAAEVFGVVVFELDWDGDLEEEDWGRVKDRVGSRRRVDRICNRIVKA